MLGNEIFLPWIKRIDEPIAIMPSESSHSTDGYACVFTWYLCVYEYVSDWREPVILAYPAHSSGKSTNRTTDNSLPPKSSRWMWSYRTWFDILWMDRVNQTPVICDMDPMNIVWRRRKALLEWVSWNAGPYAVNQTEERERFGYLVRYLNFTVRTTQALSQWCSVRTCSSNWYERVCTSSSRRRLFSPSRSPSRNTRLVGY